MGKDGEDTAPGSERGKLLWTDLRELIDILQGLYQQISSALAETRTHPVAHSDTKGREIDVAKSLDEYIDASPDTQPKSDLPHTESPDSTVDNSRKPGAKSISTANMDQTPNELSEHLKDHEVEGEFQHPLAQKMRTSTLEHFNRALQLAKEGDRDRAHQHAEYAKNAMQIASEYMSETEYEAFQKELKARVNNTKSGKVQEDAGRLSDRGLGQ